SAANNPPVIYTSSFDSGLSPMTPVIVPCGTVSDYERYWYIFRNIQQSADCGSTGIDDDYANEIALFPNPATDILNITSSETISEIEIVNTLGQVVKRIEVNSDNAVCNVEELPNGFYVVRIYNEDTKSFCQKKFAKE
ncbi:MAG: T9SS type A sorting domain-containing protein, partial [Bacteroidales bacterium]|nr:T9SS type A sorting domain-containing protein [Bacteroidales bacterium]